MNRRLAFALSVGLVAALLAPAAGALPPRAADKTDNVRLISSFPYKNKEKDFFAGGTDLDFKGKYVYAMQQGPKGGVHIFDVSEATPRKVSFISCPGEQNDVAVVKPGLIAIGYHSSQCGGTAGAGIRLVNVKRPKAPKYLGAIDLPGGSHTLTLYPGTSLIYSSPNGLGNVSGTQSIVDVSNPAKPKVAASYKPPGNSCHDLSFRITEEEQLAFCPGTSGLEIWDVSDPLAPKMLSKTANPSVQYHHSAVATHDGKYLVLGDEAVAASDCAGGTSGSLWVYDITIREAPVLVGRWGPQRGPQPAGSSNTDRNTWCSAHNFNFVPGTYTLVGAWYAGGMSAVDFSDPAAPKEVAYYMGTGDDITNYWSAYWYDGRIWANDRVKGLDVFKVKGLKEAARQP